VNDQRLRRRGDSRARSELAARYLPLARSLALRYRHTQEPIEDLVQVASLGLVKAIDLWDPDRGTPLASGDSWCFRTERDTARELGTKYDEAKRRAPRRYSEADLRAIFDLYEAEPVRGAEPRYLEDVAVGDELAPMAKGPMTVTGFIAFAQGWGGLYIRANKLAWKQLRKHPGLGIPNAAGIPDVPERVHWENDLATDVGTPGAYDYGPERCSWLIHHLTNWMGDDGFLRHHHCEIRHHNVVGDWLRITGRVVAVGTDDEGERCVTVEQEARNQNGDLSARGTGVVRLPSRA